VTNQDNLIALAHTAQKFSTRPSALLGLLDDAPALDFDIACATALLDVERKALQEVPDGKNRPFHEASLLSQKPKVTPKVTIVKDFLELEKSGLFH
jgi:hypothetical protein